MIGLNLILSFDVNHSVINSKSIITKQICGLDDNDQENDNEDNYSHDENNIDLYIVVVMSFMCPKTQI